MEKTAYGMIKYSSLGDAMKNVTKDLEKQHASVVKKARPPKEAK